MQHQEESHVVFLPQWHPWKSPIPHLPIRFVLWERRRYFVGRSFSVSYIHYHRNHILRYALFLQRVRTPIHPAAHRSDRSHPSSIILTTDIGEGRKQRRRLRETKK